MAELTLRQWCGWALIVVSSAAWAFLPIVPFLPLDAAQKVALAGSLFLFAEITWWLAIPLLGKEFMALSAQLWRWCKSSLGFADDHGHRKAEPDKQETDSVDTETPR